MDSIQVTDQENTVQPIEQVNWKRAPKMEKDDVHINTNITINYEWNWFPKLSHIIRSLGPVLHENTLTQSKNNLEKDTQNGDE